MTYVTHPANDRIDGKALRAFRKSQGYSITEFARILRIEAASTVHRWERGDRVVSGPASVIIEMMQAGELPERYMAVAKPAA